MNFDEYLRSDEAQLREQVGVQQGEIFLLKTLLRRYAVTVVGTSSHGNVQCNCCHYFGLYAHKEGCELAPYLTKES